MKGIKCFWCLELWLYKRAGVSIICISDLEWTSLVLFSLKCVLSGAKKNGLIKQLLRDVDWGGLDYLLVDTPPGSEIVLYPCA